MENLILKYFLNDWNFMKIISKLDYAEWHVLRENWDETACMSVFGTIYETKLLHGRLHESWF